MDIVKAEIARKRKALEERKLVTSDRKYFKRSTLRDIEKKEYFEKSKHYVSKNCADADGLDSVLKKPNDEENLLLKKFEERTREEKEKGAILPRRDVIKQLRERKQPIRLYGETDWDTFQRLKRVQLLEPETNGLRNDLIAALDKVDDADDEDVFVVNRKLQIGGDGTSAAGEPGLLEVTIKKDMLTEENIREMKYLLSCYVTKHEGTNTDDATKAALQLAVNLRQQYPELSKLDGEIDDDDAGFKGREIACDYSLKFLKFLLTTWGNSLNSRTRDEKLSYSGKMASATYAQTVEYIKPLFRTLKRRVYQVDILDSLVKVCVLLMDRNYIKANDCYLELAIGNAPWPLGVTNHGIHSRTAQEKIHAKNVAHVLNDEVQRKFIQAIKRLMTKAQKFFVTDPSKCVNYMEGLAM